MARFRVRVELRTVVDFEVGPPLYGAMTEEAAHAMLRGHDDLMHLSMSCGTEGSIRRASEIRTKLVRLMTITPRKPKKARHARK